VNCRCSMKGAKRGWRIVLRDNYKEKVIHNLKQLEHPRVAASHAYGASCIYLLSFASDLVDDVFYSGELVGSYTRIQAVKKCLDPLNDFLFLARLC